MKIIDHARYGNQRRQTRERPRRARWFLLAGVILAVVFAVIVAGCGPDQSAKSDPKSNSPNGKAAAGDSSEDQARAKLKIALDAWVFGDDEAKFKQDHPEIKFLDTDFVQGHKLLKYDLGAGRKFSPSKNETAGFEFAVTLSFEGRTGREIKETRPFWVNKTDGQWVIMKTPG